MNLKRRNFIRLSSVLAGTAVTTGFQSLSSGNHAATPARSMISDVQPISAQERKERVAKAQRLMQQNNMAALIIEGGTAMEYFTGISWWNSERTMVAIIPARGEIMYVCPGFEKGRFQELVSLGNKIYVWQEDESPYKQIVHALNESGIYSGKIGIEEQLRFFVVDGIRKEAPQMVFETADAITIPCCKKQVISPLLRLKSE